MSRKKRKDTKNVRSSVTTKYEEANLRADTSFEFVPPHNTMWVPECD